MRWDPREQPCIPALTTGLRADGPRTVTVTAVDALRHADELAAVYGDTPGETAALLEWLLGLLYAAGHHPTDEDEWRDWVLTPEPLAPAADWLARHEGVWDLFDPVRPLGQNAALRPHLAAFGTGPAQLVIEHAGDYNQHFDHRHLHHPAPLPADRAWRAMLAQHTFGQGRRARIPAKEMGLPAPFTNLSSCRLGSRVRVFALGRTLGETLRLNLVPWEPDPDVEPHRRSGTLNLSWGDRADRRPFARTGGHETRLPDGPADYHTVLGRSIVLRPVRLPGGTLGVDRVLVGPGETLGVLPAAYRDDEVLTMRGKKAEVFRPRRSRELWCEAHALYAAAPTERTKGQDLYGRLASLRGLRPELWAVGLLAEKGTPIAWVSDHFPYVPGREADLRHASEQGSVIAEYAATALQKAAAAACAVEYPNPKPADQAAQLARFNGEPELWAGAGTEFHDLLGGVADGEAVHTLLAAYGRAIRGLATAALGARLHSRRSGPSLHARIRAEERLTAELNHRTAPVPLREAIP
ncbi:type I-E CRISPR-associated protein Cse1/CasA [Kitasatospora sp. NPDC093806]|uniref:type I-E CRISPR-associated protein Cse1/CasA n=1 Tax=Kitasatospora sp. NPDC093806 TaxID=3155075 RepID=UPI0034449896